MAPIDFSRIRRTLLVAASPAGALPEERAAHFPADATPPTLDRTSGAGPAAGEGPDANLGELASTGKSAMPEDPGVIPPIFMSLIIPIMFIMLIISF